MTETPQLVEFSFKEKYFQVQPEGRIRRRAYLWRGIVTIIVAFVGLLIAGALSSLLSLSPLLTYLLDAVPVLFSVWLQRALIYKRARDIGAWGGKNGWSILRSIFFQHSPSGGDSFLFAL